MPELPQELWQCILEKTDISTCFDFGNLRAARAFLSTKKSSEKAYSQVVKSDNVDHFKLVVNMMGIKFGKYSSIKESAAASGSLQILRYLADHALGSHSHYIATCAARSGHLNIVQFVFEEHKEEGFYAVEVAAELGHQHIVKYLLERNPWGYQSQGRRQACLKAASLGGHVQLAQEIFDTYPDSHCPRAVYKAALGGSLALMQFYLEHYREAFESMECGFRFASYILYGAVQGCHMHILELLDSVGYGGELYQDANNILHIPAFRGRLDILRWVEEHYGVKLTEQTMDSAAAGRQVSMLEYMWEKGLRCTTKGLDRCAATGDLECVKWLHDHGMGARTGQ